VGATTCNPGDLGLQKFNFFSG